MKPAIRVKNLTKRYQLGTRRRDGYRTLRESLMDGLSRPFRRPRDRAAESADVLWALKDVSFEVAPGEVIGIIGGNGAGKSTLLKILSRVTEPTAGRIEVRGRVGSLLEVGTGFHSELTGRENIFLSGAILGMSRQEIRRKFDQIVAFAGVERFLDTPAKRYSSGMYVRLAFAVAAHLDPEILIVDEVLAVGDTEFQKKCLGRMEEVSRGGRTVFFVSHNMDVVQRLCRQVLLMEKGRLMAQGPQAEILARYLAGGTTTLSPNRPFDLAEAARRGTGEAKFVSVRYGSGTPATANRAYPDGPLTVAVTIQSNEPRPVASLAVSLANRFGTLLVNADTLARGQTIALRTGPNEFVFHIEQLHLNPGTYFLNLWLANPGHIFDQVEQAAPLEVVERPAAGFGMRPPGDGCVTCRFTLTDGMEGARP